MAGAKEIVSWLKEEGSLVAVSAGTDRGLAKKKLKATDLFKYIDFMVTASDVGIMKPHPDYFQLIMTELKVNAAQTLVVSDSKKEDIEEAQRLNLKTIEIPPNNPHLTALKPELSEFLSFAK
jgi:putative hydrolase of the HAD superfamily